MAELSAIAIKQATSEDAAKILPLLAQFVEEDGFDIAFKNLLTAIAAMLNDPGSAIFVAWSERDRCGNSDYWCRVTKMVVSLHIRLHFNYVCVMHI